MMDPEQNQGVNHPEVFPANPNIRWEYKVLKPELARELLAAKHVNRRVVKKHVEELIDEIKSGNWKEIHQPIGIDSEGHMVDGQHRCTAVSQSGISISSWFAYGVKEEDYPYIDAGFPRDLSARTRLPEFFVSIYAFLLNTASGNYSRPQSYDVQKLHQELAPLVEMLQIPKAGRFYSTVPIRAAAVIAIKSGQDQEYVLDFYKNLAQSNYYLLPPVASAFVRWHQQQASLLKGATSWKIRLETYYRARYLFQKENKDFDKLHISEKMEAEYKAQTKAIVERLLQ
jgi:hypothetical protein